ncbi:MAG: sigma-70 family RNA polymerase sigma factor [Lachnospiraceae bacterium]|nr:sigma-70 family RNA polymerase sigma factor [Lachnospiraceae bacterium]
MADSNTPFEQVYNENFSYIYNYIYMRVVHKETAEDLCSQTFLNAFSHYDSYDKSKAGVRTWLCTIARNLTVNYLTSSSVRLNSPLDDDISHPSLSYEDNYDVFKESANREAARLLSLLDDDSRELLSLRYGLEMSVAELAGYYGITENAVRKRIKKALTKCLSFTEGKDLSEFL